MSQGARRRLALVVPGLASAGGVQAVAKFIKDVVVRSGRYDLLAISLSESAQDPASLRLTSPRSWRQGTRATAGEWEGVPFLHVGAVAGELEFQRYRPREALSRVLAGCDLIQIVCGTPAWGNAVIGLKMPVAMHVATRAKVERRQRDARPRSFPALWRRAMTNITDRMDDHALRGVDAILVMNPWMLEYAKTVNAGRTVDLRYLPPGVDVDEFRPLVRAKPVTDRYVLCVGRLSDPRKRLAVLLEAYAQLPPTLRGQVRLVLAGSAPAPEGFWSRAQMLGVRERISYIERPDRGSLRRLFQEADAFALPSDEEGFGMVVLEAMACGVPVVSTRSGGPDAIITDGQDGYLVDRDDVSALSARLASLLREPALATEMGCRARMTIERRYDARVAGAGFLDVWEQMTHITRPTVA